MPQGFVTCFKSRQLRNKLMGQGHWESFSAMAQGAILLIVILPSAQHPNDSALLLLPSYRVTRSRAGKLDTAWHFPRVAPQPGLSEIKDQIHALDNCKTCSNGLKRNSSVTRNPSSRRLKYNYVTPHRLPDSEH
ncbi:hypothetical protein RJZ57_006941 [Blastomyces gilchristii]